MRFTSSDIEGEERGHFTAMIATMHAGRHRRLMKQGEQHLTGAGDLHHHQTGTRQPDSLSHLAFHSRFRSNVRRVGVVCGPAKVTFHPDNDVVVVSVDAILGL